MPARKRSSNEEVQAQAAKKIKKIDCSFENLQISKHRSASKIKHDPLNRINSEDICKLDVIGYGAYATVYKGIYIYCPVALKCVSSKVSENDFLKEVILMR